MPRVVEDGQPDTFVDDTDSGTTSLTVDGVTIDVTDCNGDRKMIAAKLKRQADIDAIAAANFGSKAFGIVTIKDAPLVNAETVRKMAAALGRLGGKMTSDAKTAACRENAKKPRKRRKP